MIWNKLKTWILCATAILSVGALGISVHSVKEDTELMEVAAESIASSTAKVTFNPGKLHSMEGSSAGAVGYFVYYAVEDPFDPNGIAIPNNQSDQDMTSTFGCWKMAIRDAGRQLRWREEAGQDTLTPDGSSSLKLIQTVNGRPGNGSYINTWTTNLDIYFLYSGASFTPISVGARAKSDGECTLAVSQSTNGSVNCSTAWDNYSFVVSQDYSVPTQAQFKTTVTLTLTKSGWYKPNTDQFWYLSDIALVYTTPELQFAAACSAYRNLGFTYDKNGAGEFTAFRNPRLRFKLNLPSDYSAYIDNESISVRVRFKNGEAYSEMVLEGSTFMSDGSGGYTCTFSLTNIPPEHFQDEVSFIPIIEGMDLVEQTGTYRTPKCCVITLGASVKSMVDAYRGSLYSSLTEAQQQAITAFAEYYASYLA